MARVCFLFNHDGLHQIAHSLPIAQALQAHGGHEIVLATGSQAIADHLANVGTRGLPTVLLDLERPFSRALAATLNAVVPARKILLYRDNLDFFRSFDALVVSEKTSLLLKTRYGLEGLRIIHTRHGAGDRAIGFGRQSAQFDLVLVAGPKIAERLVREAGVDPARIRLVGYPKFDLYGQTRIDNPFPDPTRPTVLYAPHPSPRLSSWYRMGPGILRAFARQERYNLVFAPHVMLFRRNWTLTIDPPALARVPQVPAEAMAAPHVLIDTGSARSSDMSYTNLADVYLGDASSQIYEFLLRPRPVVHLDAHGVKWRNNPDFAHWMAGPVVGAGEDVLAGIETAIETRDAYRSTQEDMFAQTFSVTEEASSARAARAIADYLAGD